MRNKALYIILILMIAALTACGPKPAPTMSPADAQGTAIAAAWTVVAITQASIPTATPVPPTAIPIPTAFPTWTPQPAPTFSASFPTQPGFVGVPTNPPSVGGPTADTCNLPVSSKAAGPKVNTRIFNQTDGNVVLSLYLSKTVFNECGYYSFHIGPNSSITAQLLEGSYWAGAFVTGKKDSKAFGTSLLLKSPSSSIRISDDVIK